MQSFLVNGSPLSFLDQGSGVPLLLVHGFPLSHRMWLSQVDDLSADFRLLAPDLPGFGQSPLSGDEISMEQLADDLISLLDELEITEPVVFCGLSMGGYIAWQFWRKYRSRLRGLIVCDTRADGDTPEVANNRHKMADHVLQRGTELVAEAMLPKLFARTTFKNHPEVVDVVRQDILTSSPRSVAAAQEGMADRRDMSAELSRIDVPTLVIVGQDDQISPVDVMRPIAEAIPGAELCVVPDAGHMAPMENPAVVNAAIRKFVSKQS